MAILKKVFGVRNEINADLYVVRNELDAAVQSAISAPDIHIVIRGASKQGKTWLRRRVLADNRCIQVDCTNYSTLTSLYIEVLRQLGVKHLASEEIGGGTKNAHSSEKAGGLKIPYVDVSRKTADSQESTQTTKSTYVPNGHQEFSLVRLAQEIAAHQERRVIIEDYHKLPQEQQRELASHLKVFANHGAQIILIGVGEQANVFTVYDGDLRGRIRDISSIWTPTELAEVLSKGETALRIQFVPSIRRKLIADAAGNVGLLQRLAYELCFAANVEKTTPGHEPVRAVGDNNLLKTARRVICQESDAIYRSFISILYGGVPDSDTPTFVFKRIVQAIVKTDDRDLQDGLTLPTMIEKVREIEKTQSTDESAKPEDIQGALLHVNDLLRSRLNNTGEIVSYNAELEILTLVDWELLFWKRYRNLITPRPFRFPWESR